LADHLRPKPPFENETTVNSQDELTVAASAKSTDPLRRVLYFALTDHIFSWLERPGSKAVTSTITMMELLVHPYRELDQSRADEFYGLLSTYPNLEWIAPDLEIADLAARMRARHRLQSPDGLQAATAAHSKATALITNDPLFERVEAFETLVLDQIL
jgi:predicted nucleic acid-binding protein